jgi:hypothetical protein
MSKKTQVVDVTDLVIQSLATCIAQCTPDKQPSKELLEGFLSMIQMKARLELDLGKYDQVLTDLNNRVNSLQAAIGMRQVAGGGFPSMGPQR